MKTFPVKLTANALLMRNPSQILPLFELRAKVKNMLSPAQRITIGRASAVAQELPWSRADIYAEVYGAKFNIME